MNIDGHAIATDKLDHIVYDGWRMFRKASEAEALKSSELEEKGLNGLEASGVYSNGDIAAQMAGRQFYLDVFKAFQTKSDYTFDIRSFSLDKMDENKNVNTYAPDMEKRVKENEARFGSSN